MPFPRRLLTEGEDILLDLRQHWSALAGPVLVTVLIVAASVAGGIGLSKTSADARATYVLVGAAVLLFCIFALPSILTWATTRFALSNERIITRSGVIAKRSKEIPLEVVNDITFTQTFIGRLLGAGTLLVESAGERGQEFFRNVSKPEEVQKTIYRASESRKGLGPGQGTSGSVADEIAKLAALRDSGTISSTEFEARKQLLLGS